MRRKIDLELKRVEETLDRRGRRELYRQDPRLGHLPEFLRPRRGPQERGISGAPCSACYLVVSAFGPSMPPATT